MRLLKDMALPRLLFMDVACQHANGTLLAGQGHYCKSPCIHNLMTGTYLYTPTSKEIAVRHSVNSGVVFLLLTGVIISRSSAVEKLLGYFQKKYVCCEPIRSDLRDIIPVNSL
jgi:hypothetical protein